MLKIGFFGTPTLAAQVLRDFLGSPDMEVVFVVTGEDKPVGRHQVLTANNVKKLAIEHDIPCLQPAKIRGNTEFLDALRSYEADYFVTVAYGKILPAELLTIPRKYPINIHGSILPKYRGASPIQAALIAGEKETGVTIMVMDDKMDEGDIIDILPIPIASDETSGSLFEKFAHVSGAFAIETLLSLDKGILKPRPQDHALATYCKKISKEDGRLDFSRSSEELYHLYQGLTPWPGVFTEYEGKKLIIEQCSYIPTGDGKAEKIGSVVRIDGGVGIICGEWILTLSHIKLEWKKSQSIKDFVNGHRDFIGKQVF
ncbi:MAG: Methionyl-tRNA formyltransferase [uncultured bacterium (gcode 4)]|uniref:Methionyl-tRNA formyltransferase n=1 Tax=uncultured bacterium (gcode 4) TaxID=1234023 RepID=K1XXC4_9BACT|nr:MAG: Methionyl-tRNA formyltransferase [uncultured bacterium (gcode 4)]